MKHKKSKIIIYMTSNFESVVGFDPCRNICTRIIIQDNTFVVSGCVFSVEYNTQSLVVLDGEPINSFVLFEITIHYQNIILPNKQHKFLNHHQIDVK